jgi:glyoxylase-like metal-dependent hydrolase (beta-lactamase superfamily II)
MRPLGLIIISFTIAIVVKGQSSDKKLNIVQLTGDFFVYTTYKDFNGKLFPSNSMYVVTDSGIVLVDTPWDTTQFQPLLDSIERRHDKKVVLCISTHYHDDRTAGVEFYKQRGIKTYASKQTYELCKKLNEKQPEFYFSKDTVFNFGKYSIETYYPGEGHTKDNIALWFNDAKLLYGGCLIKSVENDNLGNVANANIVEWPKSIRNLISKYRDVKYIIPGHFSWKSNKTLQHTLILLQKNKTPSN